MLRGLLFALCALALSAPAAVAADDEIFVDPGSPSGKEYALPIDRARKEAARDTKGAKDAKGQSATPLFGEGVDAASTPGASGRRAGGGGKAAADDANPSAAGTGAGSRETAPKTLKAQAAAPDGGIGVAAIIGGVSVGVLLLGAAIGVLLRRRASRPA